MENIWSSIASILTVSVDSNSVAFWGAVIGIFTFYMGHRFAKKKFVHELTLKCIETYQSIVKDDNLDNCNIYRYLGYMNEELYYIRNGLVDKKMALEWLSNMINYLPIIIMTKNCRCITINQKILQDSKSIFDGDLNENHKLDILFRYMRIRKIILITGDESDYEFRYEDHLLLAYEHIPHNTLIREKIVRQMLVNLNSDCWYRKFYFKYMPNFIIF